MKRFLSVAAFVLLLAGVASAGLAPSPTPGAVSVPTMMPWGMVGTAAAMGVSGLFFIFKRKK